MQPAADAQEGEEEAGRKQKRHGNPESLVFPRKRQLICSQVETGSVDVGVCVCVCAHTGVCKIPAHAFLCRSSQVAQW